MVVKIDRIRPLLIIVACEPAVGFGGIAETPYIIGRGFQGAVDARSEDHRGGRKLTPQRYVVVLFRTNISWTWDQHIDQAFLCPSVDIHAHSHGIHHLTRHPDGDPEAVSPLLFRFIGGGTDIPHKLGQDGGIDLIVARFEDRRTAEPVQLDPVRFIVQQIFPCHGKVVIINFLLTVIKSAVHPFPPPAVAVPRPDQILPFLPEVAVLGTVFLSDPGMMDIIHTHTVPHFHALFVTVIVTELHIVRTVLFQRSVVDIEHLILICAVLLRNRFPPQEQGAVFRHFQILIVRRTDLGRVETALEVHVVKDGFHAAAGSIKIHICPDALCGHLFRFCDPEIPCVRIDKNPAHKLTP